MNLRTPNTIASLIPFSGRGEAARGTLHVARYTMTAATLWVAVWSAGCASTPPAPEVSENIVLVSDNGSALFYRAKDTYAAIRQQDLTGDAFVAEMDKALRLLDAAIVNDPGNPLFHSKRADLWLELGEFDNASAGYAQARAITEDWVPSWIGDADIALVQGRLADAGNLLTSAWSAVRAAEGTAPKPTDPYAELYALIGLNIQTPPEVADPDDPTLNEMTRKQLQLHWLQESESWTIENPALTTEVDGQIGKLRVDQAGLFRRLRAAIEYRRARLAWIQSNQASSLNQGVTASAQQKLDQALTWDPNYFPAKLMRAELFAVDGRYKDAERILRPYLDSPDPKLAGNGQLLHAMANVYAEWFVLEPSAELADEADGFFTKLHTLNPKHGPGYLDRARFYLATGEHFDRPDTLQAGLACLDQADALSGEPWPESKALREQLTAALP
ncbi:MAG: hypothetical protein AAGA25_14785 [Planctomycetota bacterium]